MIYKSFLNLVAFFYGFSLLLSNNVLLRYFFLGLLIIVVGLNLANQFKLLVFKKEKIRENLKMTGLILFFRKHSFFFLLFIFFHLLSLTMNDYSFDEIKSSGVSWFHEFLFLYLLTLFFGLSKNVLPAFFAGLLSGVYTSCLVSIVQYVTYYHSPLLKYITRHHLLKFDFVGFGFQPPEYELISKSIPRVAGFHLNPNVYAYGLAMALMSALAFLFMKKPVRQKILVSLILFTGIFILGITYSRGGWIAFICGVLGFLWFGKKKLLPFILSLIITGNVLFYSNSGFREKIASIFDSGYTSNVQRIELFVDAWGSFVSSPLWGVGLHRNDQILFYKDYKLGYRMQQTHSHNMYLELLKGVGLLGFLSLMAFFLTVLKMILKSRSLDQENSILWSGLFATTLIFLVGGLFDAAFGLIEIRSLFFTCLSIVFFMWEKQKFSFS